MVLTVQLVRKVHKVLPVLMVLMVQLVRKAHKAQQVLME
jgi:hypothetical protein